MTAIVAKDGALLLVGGGTLDPDDLRRVHNLCAAVVAVDSGADALLAEGVTPDWVVGDFDSVSAAALARVPPARQIRIAEQDTTDFEKALSQSSARAVICLGFTGARIDHELAVYSALLRRPDVRAVVLGGVDLCFHTREIAMDLPPGTRVSLFPLAPVRGRSEGLVWPIDGLDLAPAGRIGTSNQATGPVRLAFDGNGMLVILPKRALPAVWAAWGLTG